MAAGAANIAKISAQQYPAYALGGHIPSGKYGLVGEAGPELVRGPAVVTSAASTASKQQSSGIRSVTVHNNGQPVEATARLNGDELMIMLQPLLAKNKAETKDELASEISRGGGKVSQRLESTYSLRRGGKT